jgi:hypothetical protein
LRKPKTVAFKGLRPIARRSAFLVVALDIVIVTFPLAVTTFDINQQRLITRETIPLTEQWLTGTGYEFHDAQISGNQVTLVINGLGERPELSELGDQLSTALDQPIDIKLDIVPSQEENYFAKNQ